jgi:hypothetical protein
MPTSRSSNPGADQVTRGLAQTGIAITPWPDPHPTQRRANPAGSAGAAASHAKALDLPVCLADDAQDGWHTGRRRCLAWLIRVCLPACDRVGDPAAVPTSCPGSSTAHPSTARPTQIARRTVSRTGSRRVFEKCVELRGFEPRTSCMPWNADQFTRDRDSSLATRLTWPFVQTGSLPFTRVHRGR